jgi:integrase/recombinase XerD
MTSSNIVIEARQAATRKEVSRGELRERMQHDLVVRGMSSRTQEAYLAAVKGVAQHYRQRPDTLSAQQVEGYVRHLIEPRHLAPNSVGVAVVGLRFVSTVTLKRPAFALPLPKGGKKLPEVLSREEVARLLASTATLRERALLMTTYGGGLRVSEVVRLRVSDIDAERGMLRVEQGKGCKDRYTLLGTRLLAELRHYWQVYRPTPPWVFPQRSKPVPMDPTTAQKMYYAAKRRAGIPKAGGIHALRHAFATHLVEAGTDLATLQQLLGHDSITTTMRYVHVARTQVAVHGSPLDDLQLDPEQTV